MEQSSRRSGRRRTGRLGACLLAISLSLVTLGAGGVAQAQEQRHDGGPRHDDGRRHDDHHPPFHRPPPRYYRPPPVVVAPPARGYYAAPPVVMSPPGLTIVIPIH